MELGQYRFLLEKGCLENCQTGQVKPLNRNEVLVLKQLIQHQGETLSKYELSCDGGEIPLIKESAVVKAVCTLRQALGEPEASYIHTVPKEGYQLVALGGDLAQESDETEELLPINKAESPFCLSSIWKPLAVGTLMILLVLVVIAQFSPPHPIRATSEINNEYGQSMKVSIITSSQSNMKEMNDYAQNLTTHLSSCVYFPWDEVHLALSHDKQMLNVTLLRKGPDGDVRNIKISDFRVHPKFIDPKWLRREFECE